jgi:D-lactate dehydrogenase (cytochrome)
MFEAVLGGEQVNSDPDYCLALSGDIAGEAAQPAACVVCPRSEVDVVAVIEACRRHGIALHPRGGGYSYTGGFRPDAEASVVVDMRALNGIRIDDGTVAVGAGVTWRAVHGALDEKGLRVPSFGPLSGAVATIGGSLAQNGGFFGAAAYGSYADRSVESSTMLDGTGQIVTTNRRDLLASTDWPQPLAGDCGAFGIRVSARLRTMPRPDKNAFASLAFETSQEAFAALAALSGLAGLAEAYVFDPGTHVNLAVTGFSLLESAGIAADLVQSRASWRDRLGGLVDAARSRTTLVADLSYSLHLTFEGTAEVVAAAQAEAFDKLQDFSPRAIPDVIPRVTRAKPFRPVKAVLGPSGERWLPVHGIVPAPQALAAVRAVEQCLAEHCETMDRNGIRAVVLAVLLGDRVIVEPQLFWPDSLHATHRVLVQPKQSAAYGARPPRIEAREAAHELRTALRERLDGLSARHFQIGRTYCAPGVIPPDIRSAWMMLKQRHDPDRIMNPGVLGLS